MTTRRFDVIPIAEINRDKISFHSSEIIPLINVENDIPSPPALPPSFISINETGKTPTRLFNSFLHRLKPSASTMDIKKLDQSSLSIPHSISFTNLHTGREIEESDFPYYASHSNIFDTNSLHLNNKFLHELRLKRRELLDKAKNLSVDQRIALHRRQRDVIPAQDIFDIHFELNDDDNNIQDNLFNEDTQEKIRHNIFNELDRQRNKQYHKQHRQLILGRALLIFITSLLAFMSITLIIVVINLYDRAKYFDAKLSDKEFLSMIYDKTTDF